MRIQPALVLAFIIGCQLAVGFMGWAEYEIRKHERAQTQGKGE